MENDLKERLVALGQEHLITDLDSCSALQIQECLKQISRWTPEFAQEQKRSWQERFRQFVLVPFSECSMAKEQKIGMPSRKTVALMLAGGQGSRLGVKGPKGCFPLLGKSLFARLCEKMAQNAPLAILTSQLNHQETIAFFEKNQFFGLNEVLFFSQDTMPLLDEEGRWFWEAPGRIAEGPDGNGSVFKAFEAAGLLERFANMGVEVVHIVPVDNPLADPFDPILSSFHQGDITIKCIRLTDANEPMGRLVQIGHRLEIAEFAELTDEQRHQNLLANTGLLAMDLNFMRQLAKKNFPLHWALKNFAGRSVWKGERFIVDALLYTKKSRALCYPREACYAPLKEKSSIAEIEQSLMERERGFVV